MLLLVSGGYLIELYRFLLEVWCEPHIRPICGIFVNNSVKASFNLVPDGNFAMAC